MTNTHANIKYIFVVGQTVPSLSIMSILHCFLVTSFFHRFLLYINGNRYGDIPLILWEIGRQRNDNPLTYYFVLRCPFGLTSKIIASVNVHKSFSISLSHRLEKAYIFPFAFHEDLRKQHRWKNKHFSTFLTPVIPAFKFSF